MNLWAPYGDAIKLILRGDTTKPLNPDQRTLFVRMVDQGRRDEHGNGRDQRELSGVRTKDHDGERFYHIPDLVRFMLKNLIGMESVQAPPFDLDYLNSLQDDQGMPFFLFGAAPGVQTWSDTETGKRHWKLVCEEIQIRKDIQTHRGMHHAGDPGKWRQIEDNIEGLNNRLEAVRSEMRDIEAGRESVRKIIPFTPPKRTRDDWPELITDAIKEFEAEHGFTGSASQIWARLHQAPPQGWRYEPTHSGLKMGGARLARADFKDRFDRFYPNEKP